MKNSVYIGFGTLHVSAIHVGSYNIFPNQGRTLVRFAHLTFYIFKAPVTVFRDCPLLELRGAAGQILASSNSFPVWLYLAHNS